MNSKDVKGIAVISIADGRKLGTVDHAYLDPAAKRVAGFAANCGGGLFEAPDRGLLIDTAQVHSLGPDALTLADATAATGKAIEEAYGDLLFLSDLDGRQVVTEGGTDVGQVVSADFDERTFALTALETSPGHFQANQRLPIEQVITLGQDVIVVSDAVRQSGGGGTVPAQEQEQQPAGPTDAVTAGHVTVHESDAVVAGAGFDDAPPHGGRQGAGR